MTPIKSHRNPSIDSQRKSTHALKSRKMGTLKTSIQRKNVNYSTEKHLKDELKHIRKTANEINYPY